MLEENAGRSAGELTPNQVRPGVPGGNRHATAQAQRLEDAGPADGVGQASWRRALDDRRVLELAPGGEVASGDRPEATARWTVRGQDPAAVSTPGDAVPGIRVVTWPGTAVTSGAFEPTPLATRSQEVGVPPDVLPQIVKAVRLQWRQGVGEARLRLEPEHLGEINVALRVQDGVVTAVVRAEQPAVQAWIEARQQELRSAMTEQGLTLERFDVSVSPDGRRRSQPDTRDARPSRQRPATGARFEIHV
jgi:hypothetical protein